MSTQEHFKPKQRQALQEILQGKEPEIPTKVQVPALRKKRNPEADENGVYEARPLNAEVGDKWKDEDGKTWEMGKGGPMKVSRMQQFRCPMFCPDCGSIMNGKFDEKFWRLYGHCMDCQQKKEQKMKLEGTYETWARKKKLENKKAWLRDIKQGLSEIVKAGNKEEKKVINGDGDVATFQPASESAFDEMVENARSFIENAEQEIKDEEEALQ